MLSDLRQVSVLLGLLVYRVCNSAPDGSSPRGCVQPLVVGHRLAYPVYPLILFRFPFFSVVADF